MLAQTFKTHQDLNLDPQVYEGLKKVLVRLETGDLVWVGNDRNPPANGFNMDWDFKTVGCGSIGCLGGWTAYEMRDGDCVDLCDVMYIDVDLCDVMYIEELEPLFYPCSIDWERITVEQAAATLRNYLTTGEIDWT